MVIKRREERRTLLGNLKELWMPVIIQDKSCNTTTAWF